MDENADSDIISTEYQFFYKYFSQKRINSTLKKFGIYNKIYIQYILVTTSFKYFIVHLKYFEF